jgi:hypothetical protein
MTRKRKPSVAAAETPAAPPHQVNGPAEPDAATHESMNGATSDHASAEGPGPAEGNGARAKDGRGPRRPGGRRRAATKISAEPSDEASVQGHPAAPPRHHSASSIQGRDVEWLYPGFLARRFAGLLYGPSTVGKSTLERWFTACLTNGWALPGADAYRKQTVLWITSEETPEDVVKVRLAEMGTDMDRVYFLDRPLEGDAKAWTFPEDKARLVACIEHYGAALVVIDKIRHHIDPGLAIYGNDTGILVMTALNDAAAATGAHVLAGGHPRKGTGRNADEGLAGGQEWFNTPRSVLYYGRSSTQPGQRVLIQQKPSLAGQVDAHNFLRVEEGGRVKLHMVRASKDTVDDVDPEEARPGQLTKLEEAKRLLVALLEPGAVASEFIYDYGRRRDISGTTMRKAKGALEVEDGGKGQGTDYKTVWKKPTQPSAEWERLVELLPTVQAS